MFKLRDEIEIKIQNKIFSIICFPFQIVWVNYNFSFLKINLDLCRALQFVKKKKTNKKGRDQRAVFLSFTPRFQIESQGLSCGNGRMRVRPIHRTSNQIQSLPSNARTVEIHCIFLGRWIRHL